MKTINLITSLLLFCSGISMAEVGNNDLDEIRKLTKEGQYQKALEKHVWFHEESKKSPGMGGVRLSYAISNWVKLGEKYPPAMQELVKIRDKDKEMLLSGNGSFQNFHDLSSINRELETDEDTLELFLVLNKKYPKQSESYYIVSEDLLIKHKKYDICATFIGDPIIKYEGIRHNRELLLSFARKDSAKNNSMMLDHADKTYVDDVVKLIEVLIAIDKRDEAIEIQKRAMTYFADDSIKNAIQ